MDEGRGWAQAPELAKKNDISHSRASHSEAPRNFSMAPAVLEFSLIFTFSRCPP